MVASISAADQRAHTPIKASMDAQTDMSRKPQLTPAVAHAGFHAATPKSRYQTTQLG